MIYDVAGINLHEGKKALVTARINKRIRALGLEDERQYLNIVLNDDSGREIISLIDVISTNVTHFYRESDHFNFLRDIFLEWQNEGKDKFRFWCAAASTGQEPYTIAITLKESEKSKYIDWKLLATDISTTVLAQCHRAVYTREHVKPVPMALQTKYFTRETGDDGDTYYRVNEILKNRIKFARLNLSKIPFPMKGPLDMVFCRNVMIYFDREVKTRLISEIHRLLRPGGYLVVGHAESLTGIENNFRIIRPSIYIKPK